MNAIFDVLIVLLDIYQWILLGVVLLSWVNPDPYNPIVRFLRSITDPVLTPFRRLLMPLTMQIRIDFSPILVFLLIGLLQNVLRRLQYGGLRPEALGWAVVDGAIVFVSAIAMFLFVFLLARVVVEATNADRWNPVVRFIFMVTDPLVFRFRRMRIGRGKVDGRPVIAATATLVIYLVLQQLRTIIP